ncbi:tyrosine-type recombinase/integrase [Cellulomonas hominis]|uniref:tyrosine-type recombinase/integrase n=1 Tax=Cellulomonas hominis TaxID=156981 RepID=UPI001444523B|nr:site-specific integrase [Cellulomonas hominis]NKY08981.1 tyrosine-type recombinase/integrase [Cellulomonas hominis]
MASIKKRPDGRWRARYRDEAGKEHARHFDRKVDGQRWLDEVTASVLTGTYVDPAAGRVTFASFYGEWATRQVWEATTARAMDLAAGGVTFGTVPLARLRSSHLEAWVKAMQTRGLAASTIRTRFNNVRSVLRAAARDRHLPHDPSVGVTLPRQRRREAAMVIPTPGQVGALLRAADDFAPFVALCAFAGLRLGEAAGQQPGDLEFLRRVVKVERQVQRLGGGEVEIRPPKYGSEREVGAPQGLLDLLSAHVAELDEKAEWLFPGEDGKPLHQNSVGYLWRRTRAKVPGCERLRLHDLRHFYASGLIAAGCDVVTVQRAMGHKSAAVTLTTYSHLWPSAEDRTRAAAQGMFDDALRTPGGLDGTSEALTSTVTR